MNFLGPHKMWQCLQHSEASSIVVVVAIDKHKPSATAQHSVKKHAVTFLQSLALMTLNTSKRGPAIFSAKNNENKPVGFYGPIAPPVPNAPSSECPRASITARRRAAGSITISWRASCCCSNAIARIAIEANFKMYLLSQFCWNRVKIFLQ